MYGRAVVLARVDDRDDVRVVELGDRARLAAEALELVGVARDLAVHELDRDRALEHRVEGAVDRRHPAGADLGVEPVAAGEQGADGRASWAAAYVDAHRTVYVSCSPPAFAARSRDQPCSSDRTLWVGWLAWASIAVPAC